MSGTGVLIFGGFGMVVGSFSAYALMSKGREFEAALAGVFALAMAFETGVKMERMDKSTDCPAPAPLEQKSGESPLKPQDVPVPVKKSNLAPAA